MEVAVNVLCVIRDKADLARISRVVHKCGYDTSSVSSLDDAHERIAKGVPAEKAMQ